MIHQAIQMARTTGDNDSGKPDNGNNPGNNDQASKMMEK